MIDSPHTLSDLQTRLFNLLGDAGDVKIAALFYALKRRKPMPHETNRLQQQMIGTTISRTNRKLEAYGLRIAPGEHRNTYRLIQI